MRMAIQPTLSSARTATKETPRLRTPASWDCYHQSPACLGSWTSRNLHRGRSSRPSCPRSHFPRRKMKRLKNTPAESSRIPSSQLPRQPNTEPSCMNRWSIYSWDARTQRMKVSHHTYGLSADGRRITSRKLTGAKKPLSVLVTLGGATPMSASRELATP